LIHRQSRAIESAQHFFILIQLRQQPSGSATRDDGMLRRDEPSVPRELFNAKQLRPQGQLARALGGGRVKMGCVVRADSSAPSVHCLIGLWFNQRERADFNGSMIVRMRL
jgi:hypothetical protein